MKSPKPEDYSLEFIVAWLRLDNGQGFPEKGVGRTSEQGSHQTAELELPQTSMLCICRIHHWDREQSLEGMLLKPLQGVHLDAALASYQTMMAFESEGVGMSSAKHPAVMFCYLLATEPVADTQ